MATRSQSPNPHEGLTVNVDAAVPAAVAQAGDASGSDESGAQPSLDCVAGRGWVALDAGAVYAEALSELNELRDAADGQPTEAALALFLYSKTTETLSLVKVPPAETVRSAGE